MADGSRYRPPGPDRPPTVCEALFSSLTAVMDLSGVRVLDLFAGSGALGFEALTRRSQRHSGGQQPRRGAGDAPQRRHRRTAGVHVVKATATGHLRGQPQPVDLVLLDPRTISPPTRSRQILTQLCTGWLVQGPWSWWSGAPG